MALSVEYVDQVKSNLAIWKIDGSEIKLTITTKHKEKLKKAIELLEYNLKNNKPLKDVVERINIINTLTLIYKCFLVEFLQYTENYFNEGLKESKDITLESFVCECIKQTSQPLCVLSKSYSYALRDSIIFWITSNKVNELNIKQCLSNGLSMIHICNVIGRNNLMRHLVNNYEEDLYDYIDSIYEIKAKERKLPTFTNFINEFIGLGSSDARECMDKIKKIVLNRYYHYANYLIDTNIESLNLKKDSWKIYYEEKNLSIISFDIDFSGIISDKFKLDFKRFYKEEIISYIKSQRMRSSMMSDFHASIKAINYLYLNRGISCFGEIKSIDVNLMYQYLLNEAISEKIGKNLSPKSVGKVMTNLRKITDFLIEAEYSTINHTTPTVNLFRNIKMRNVRKMTNKTEVIPEIVMTQMVECKKELNNEFQRMFDIFEGTGMRLKEVYSLEEDCLERRKDGIVLRFVPHKVLLSQRRARQEDRHEIYITEDLSKIIEEQIRQSSKLRTEMGLKYIFLTETKGKIRVIGQGFTNALNRIVIKHNICDLDDSLWKFDSRQMRKTVAATMIQNGATETEIMQQLNHKRLDTTRGHYEDVEKLELAKLNEDFFKEKFEIKVGKEQLAMYTEEERKALYIDFKLSKRDVEFGKCSKHISEGPCGKRSGTLSCANCSKLCTGNQYLDKWKSLIDNQKSIIKELENKYVAEGIGIEDYSTFIEYKREINQLKIYESVVSKIIGG